MRGVEGGGGEEGEISPMCERLGRQPLLGRCPKTRSDKEGTQGDKIVADGMQGRIFVIRYSSTLVLWTTDGQTNAPTNDKKLAH